MARKRLFVLNTISNVSFHFLALLIGFFIIPLFVKDLGQELYGIWILSRTIMGYFSLLDMGVSGGIVKYISESFAIKDYKDIRVTINTSIIFYGVIGVLVFIAAFFFSSHIVSLFNITPQNFSKAINLLKISAVFALFHWPNVAITSTMDGLMKYVPKSIFIGVSSVLNALIVLYLVYLNLSLEMILIVSSLTKFIPWVGNYILIKRSIISWRFDFNSISFSKFKEIYSFSIWVLIQQLIVIAIYQTDKIIIGVLLPVASITIYAVVTKLFYVVRQINGVFFHVIWPSIFGAAKINDKIFVEKMVSKGSRYISIIIVPLSTLGFCISSDFIRVWMGESYASYSIWAQLLFAIWFFAPMYGVFGNVLIGVGKIKLINLFGIIGMILNLTIGVIMTKYFGIGGVILGTVLTSFIFMPIQFPVFMRAINIEWKKILFPNLKIIFSSIAIMAFAYMLIKKLNINTLIGLIIFSIIYLLVNYSFLFWKFIDEEEKQDLLKVVRTIKLKFA